MSVTHIRLSELCPQRLDAGKPRKISCFLVWPPRKIWSIYVKPRGRKVPQIWTHGSHTYRLRNVVSQICVAFAAVATALHCERSSARDMPVSEQM